jgi:hypothetical protein
MFALLGCLVFAGAFDSPNLLGQTSTWQGGTGTSWFTGANWDNGIPNGVTWDAVVGNPSPTVIDTNNVNLNSLTVNANGLVTLNALRTISFGGTAPIR